MKKRLIILIAALFIGGHLQAQIEPEAGNWKTWFITSGNAHRLSAPASYKEEIEQVVKAQENLDSAGWQQILYWNAGSPGYRWQEIINKLWKTDTSANGILSQMLLAVATYDATIAAWDTKYAYKRPRPFKANSAIQAYVSAESPSYPCEHSVAAGVAVTVISHFYPALAESLRAKAEQLMASRVAAGAAFPSDTRAGFALGKTIAEKEISYTRDFVTKEKWDKKIPEGPGYWKGKYAMFPLAGKNKTVILGSGSQFRPGPPPDFAKEMEELKNFKPTFRSMSNAFYYAGDNDDVLAKKMFEYNLHLNPPRAARLVAIAAIGTYDGFISCWDAKYTYWGIRPDQYDPTFKPALIHTPPFPGYPSGHAMIGSVNAELYSYFFPADKAYFQKRAKDGAESRFHGGIHFRSDNEVGLDMGKKVAAAIIDEIKKHGIDDQLAIAKPKKLDAKVMKTAQSKN